MAQTKEFKIGFNCNAPYHISVEGLFLRSKVSSFEKLIARNYVTLKKIFSYSVFQPKVTNAEYNKLKAFGCLPLEYTDEKTLCIELLKLTEGILSKNKVLSSLAKEVFGIRAKELKYILNNVPKQKLSELCNGYIVFEKYLEFIAQ